MWKCVVQILILYSKYAYLLKPTCKSVITAVGKCGIKPYTNHNKAYTHLPKCKSARPVFPVCVCKAKKKTNITGTK